MISETAFAQGFSSAWKNITPNSEHVIRRLNLGTERIDLPVGYDSKPSRRAFINEAAFTLFKNTFNGEKLTLDSALKNKNLLEEVSAEVRSSLGRYHDITDEQLVAPSKQEWREIYLLADTISVFVRKTRSVDDDVLIAPYFHGCGFLSGCYGDLVIGSRLIEIKGGDRAFRAIDIRQLLTYCALNSLSGDHEIKSVGALNPRKGIYFFVDLDTLSLEISSKPISELYYEILHIVSSGEISR